MMCFHKGSLTLHYYLVMWTPYFRHFFTSFFIGLCRICLRVKVCNLVFIINFCSVFAGTDCVTDKYWKLHFLEWKTHSSILNFSPKNSENCILRLWSFKIFWGRMRFRCMEGQTFYWSIYHSWWQHQMSVRALRHERPSGQFSKSRGLSTSVSFFLPQPLPILFTCVIFLKVLGGVYMRKLAPARVSYCDDLSDFLSRLHDGRVISYHVIWRYTSCWENTHVIQNRKHYACTTRSSLRADRYHTETGGPFMFTWYHCKISY